MSTGEFNQIISGVRQQKKITQDDLSKGICTRQKLSRVEQGESVLDNAEKGAILQRLGKASDKLDVIAGLDEYLKVENMDDMLGELCNGRIENAKEKLREYCRETAKSTEMEIMTRRRLTGILVYEEGDYAAAEKQFCKAAQYTIGEKTWKTILGGKYSLVNTLLFSRAELENLVLLAQVWMKTGKRNAAAELLENLAEYVRERITDGEEKAGDMPKIAMLLGPFYYDTGKYMECIRLCEETLKLLRDNGLTQSMTIMLDLLTKAYDKAGKLEEYRDIRRQQEGRKWPYWKESLESIYTHFTSGVGIVNRLYFNNCVCQIFLIGETIRKQRLAYKWTQKELAKGIYQNIETLSRVENGEMPSIRKLKLLFEKLGIQKSLYFGRVVTNDFELLEKQDEIAKLQMRRENDRAEWSLEELREMLDMSITENRQQVEGMEIYQKYKKGDINEEAALQETKELLFLSYPRNGKRVPFSNEALLMNQICNLLMHQRRMDEAIKAQREIIALYEESKVKFRYHSRSVYLIMDNMARNMAYERRGEAEYWTRKSIIENLRNGKGNSIHVMLSTLVTIWMEKDREACKTYLRWAYHLADIYHMKRDMEYFEQFNKNCFGGEIQWY